MLRWSAPARATINISEREYSHGEVTGWRRSCSSADTYNMKVHKSAERELGKKRPSAPLLTNAKYQPWTNLQEGCDLLSDFSHKKELPPFKMNQITHTVSTAALRVR